MAPRNQSNNQNKKPAPVPLSQAIRQAGTGGITKQEIKQITQDSGKSSGAIIQKLDQINQNIKKNDGVGINLNSGAANMLIREASKAAPGYDNFLGLGASTFGTGKIGETLQSMVGSKATGGYINPQSGQQSMTPAVERTLLPRGMDLMPSGRQTVRGVGQQYTGGTSGAGPYDATNMPITKTTPGVGPGPWANPSNTNQTNTNDNPIIPQEPPAPPAPPNAAEQDALANQSAYDLANWSTGFRRKGSSRSKGPRNARTLGGSTRVNPVGSFRGGM
jgi:hypothetical protein